jgi:NAD(P)H-hydrate epimerase
MPPDRPAPAELWTAERAAAADRHTMEDLGVPSAVLMERAALSVSAEVEILLAAGPRPVVVWCGPGNNGGDGLAIARQLHGRGVPVRVVLVAERLGAATAAQLELARSHGVPIEASLPPVDGQALHVDALLGTGAQGSPRGAIASAIQALAGAHAPVLAVDLPSGVDPDDGSVPGPAVRATVTVTFERSKPGLHRWPGREHAGQVVVASIGLAAPAGPPAAVSLIGPEEVRSLLAARPAARHKTARGHLGLWAGSGSTPGAAVLAATAALRGGVGITTLATDDPALLRELLAARPEVIVEARADPLLPRATALCVGPGLSDAASRTGLAQVWADDPRPAVFDASALADLTPGTARAGARVITPHPGEGAAMLGRLAGEAWNSGRVQADRSRASSMLAQGYGAVVVLKGEATTVLAPDGREGIDPIGGPILATAGTGDVLAGLLGALLAGGVDPFAAARAAVFLHGVAGELAGRARPGPTALEVAERVDAALWAAQAPGFFPDRWPRARAG